MILALPVQPTHDFWRPFNSMNRVLYIILGVLVLGSAGFGLARLDEVRKLKQNLTTLDQERSALQKRIWDLQKRNGELENRLHRSANAAVNTEGDAIVDLPPGPDAGLAGPQSRRGRNIASLMSSPEVQKLMAVQQKSALDGRYASLFKQMQLSPADLEKFKNLLVEKQSAVMDVMAATQAEGLNGRVNRDQIRQLVQDAQNEVDNNIKSTLGDAAYAQYQNYETTLPQRTVVSQLEQRLSYSSTPLTDAQSAQLVQILAQTTPAGANAGGGGIVQLFGRGGPAAALTGGSVPITSDAINRAQGVLSAQQLSALQGLQQEQQASAQLLQQMRANFGNRTQGTGSPAAGSTPAPKPAAPGGG
jgi:hypothetical protein